MATVKISPIERRTSIDQGHRSAMYNEIGSYDTYMRQLLGINKLDTITKYQGFNRFKKVYPNEEISNFISYFFMVRPDLNLFSQSSENKSFGNLVTMSPEEVLHPLVINDSDMVYLYSSNPYLFGSLNSNFSNDHDFLPFLSDRVESFPTYDISIKNYETSQLYSGYKVGYGGVLNDSVTGINIDITFRESKDLFITKLFHTWVNYIDRVGNKGLYEPKTKYVYSKEYDYMTSMYYILCEPDGETIAYFYKVVGAFPLNVPHSNFSYSSGSTVDNRITITFYTSLIEPLNIMTLNDFNTNAKIPENINASGMENLKKSRAKVYDDALGGTQFYTGKPFIYGHVLNGKPVYKLYWNKNIAGADNIIYEGFKESSFKTIQVPTVGGL